MKDNTPEYHYRKEFYKKEILNAIKNIPHVIVNMSKKGTISYLLWALSFIGVAGIHRFYLRRWFSGVIYLMTGGLFGIGTVVDAFLIPRMVRSTGTPFLLTEKRTQHSASSFSSSRSSSQNSSSTENYTSIENAVLSYAKDNDGILRLSQAAIETRIDLKDLEEEVHRLVERGICEMHVTTEGRIIYLFYDFMSPGAQSKYFT